MKKIRQILKEETSDPFAGVPNDVLFDFEINLVLFMSSFPLICLLFVKVSTKDKLTTHLYQSDFASFYFSF